MPSNDLTMELFAFFNNCGYVLGRKIGEGKTRNVYEVVKRDTLDRCIAKLQKPEPDNSTIQRLINDTKEDQIYNEINTLSGLEHPNIIKVHRGLWGCEGLGYYILIEEYFDAVSLEELITENGPVKNHDRLVQIFSGIAEGLRYIHSEKNLLHRDLKSSNILISKLSDEVKITDFQNVAKLEEVADKCLPTRGGTPFTYPELLNCLINRTENHAGLQNEFYAFGVMMYHALTGELPFKYNIVEHPEGKPIIIAGERVPIALVDGNRHLDNITAQEHDHKLEELLSKNIKPEYRALLRDLLAMQHCGFDYANPDKAHRKLVQDLTELKKPKPSHFDVAISKLLASDRFEPELIEKCAEYVLAEGIRKRKEPIFHPRSGKTITKHEGREEYVITFDEHEIAVEELYESDRNGPRSHPEFTEIERPNNEGGLIIIDVYRNYSNGLWSGMWREVKERKFILLKEGKPVLRAKRTIGGEHGNVHHGATRTLSTEWVKDC